MGVYIKDVEIPESCPCELIGYGYNLYCPFFYGIPKRAKEYDECCKNGTRPDWCPLIEVPEPHGRLIDEKDIVSKDGYIIADGMACIPVKDIANVPTIVQASKENE